MTHRAMKVIAVASLVLFTFSGCNDSADSRTHSGPSSSSSPSSAPQSTPAPAKVLPDKPHSVLQGKTIVIDPGHNRGNHLHTSEINKLVDAGNGKKKPCNTTGTQTYDGYTEADFTWDTSERLSALLHANGANVVMTVKPDTPWGPCVDERARIGNEAKADAAISIHADGGPDGGSGFHVMEPSLTGPIQAPSRQLALAVRDAYRSGTGMHASDYIGQDGINPRADMAGLNLSTVPAVMLETGNMRNRGDAARLKNPAFRQSIAQSLVAALSNYLS